ncbi:MAG: TetR/AcrR family transcriptional regulator [Myxococcales bacterium]|nr:TetR/AcrR family transcriptional regulator [Myxococcales bacterium]
MSKTPKAHHPPIVPSERPGPEGGKRDANRREKVQLLCAASLELFCARGVEAVTIDEVVAKAKVPKGSFYRYFSGKEELVETLFAPLVRELRQTFELTKTALESMQSSGGLNDAYSELAATVATLLVSNIDILRLYLQENRAPDVGARRPIIRVANELDEIVVRITEVARDQGLLSAQNDLRVTALTSLGAVERLLFSYVRGDELGSPLNVSTDLIRIMLDGMRA